MNGQAISLVLADAHVATRDALRKLMEREPGVDVVASVGTRAELGDTLRALRPEVAVVDVGLVSLSDRVLDGWGPVDSATKIVVTGFAEHPDLAKKVVDGGATAFLSKDRLDEELPELVRHLR